MKLILLRHEDRYNNPEFFTLLTYKGLQKANHKQFLDILNSYNITEIYSSPFLRCIQTIYKYCFIYDKKINIDNCLYEFLNDIKFKNNIKYDINDIKKTIFSKILNIDYKSLINLTKLNYKESKESLLNRTKIFINYLKKNFSKNDNILIVSHKSTIMSIIYHIDPNIIFSPKMGDIFVIDI
tara:strand:+ start:463 stop:1008 length:546 start_codon:yes stop_codon:yes gene_type:complete